MRAGDKSMIGGRAWRRTARGRPDAVVVEEGWAARHFNDPRVGAFLAGYRRAASVETTRGGGRDSLAFYVRAAP